MFRKAWHDRAAQANNVKRSGKRQITAIEKETTALLDRIIGYSNTQVIAAYETKLAQLEA